MFYHRKTVLGLKRNFGSPLTSSSPVSKNILGKGKTRNTILSISTHFLNANSSKTSPLFLTFCGKKLPVSITMAKDVTDSKLRICLHYKVRAPVHHRHSHPRVTQPFFAACLFKQFKPLWENSKKQMNMGRDANGTNTITSPSSIHITCLAPAVYFHPLTKRINPNNNSLFHQQHYQHRVDLGKSNAASGFSGHCLTYSYT